MQRALMSLGMLMLVGSVVAAPVALIPRPARMSENRGICKISAAAPLLYPVGDPELERIARLAAAEIGRSNGWNLTAAPDEAQKRRIPAIRIGLDPALAGLGSEGYHLTIALAGVALNAAAPEGLYRGVQTLRQLIPRASAGQRSRSFTLPCLEISDQPRFAWRGVMVDVGRHFHSIRFMKEILDWMALCKMNRLHWHLTDDQGWRIEIKKYPRLTEVGAWRTEADGSRYGGFYTQAEIREVVAYAADRHIEVVPEIEMPGHCMAALAAYPELSCSGGPFTVQTQWGVFKEVYCAGKEETFTFLEAVLTEVIGLFPGEYIHIGGDEVPRDRWQSCPLCQKRIQSEGLSDEAELQTWFISRIGTFLAAHGRRLIGWDEILEGGLTPGATVQSWRGMEGALAAAQAGHDAIVSPGSHTYFNADIGALDLRKAYSFAPLPAGLAAEAKGHILGGECCLWSERITEENLGYQLFPRLFALSEVLWSPEGERDYDSFLERLRRHYPLLEALGIHYGPEARPVSILTRFDPASRSHAVTLESGEKGTELHYTLDGAEPTAAMPLYQAPFTLRQPATIKARAFRAGQPYGESAVRALLYHAGMGGALHLENPPSPRYTGGGAAALVDGLCGSTSFADGCWQGFEAEDLIATLDLGALQPVHRLRAGFLQETNSWIFLPAFVEWSVSKDGVNYKSVAAWDHPTAAGTSRVYIQEDQVELAGIEARYIRLRARNVGFCPAWHPGAGGKAWIFADEIIVE
ncbi:MAG TPA: family 20 glycosylhydrolase [bacterium]|nr:family 20 glycosylhydrolase [bacterium]HNW61196.1 family 20 glycosylhydrolase [bacterium]